MLPALQNAGALLLTKTTNFSPSDGYLAYQLDVIFGGTTYRHHVIANYYDPLAAGTYDKSNGGVLYGETDYVNLIRTARANQGIANLAAWDIGMGLVGAAYCGANTSAWIAGVKAEIDELDGNEYYDVIGLAGAVYSLAFVNEDYDPTAGEHAAASSLADLADILVTYQIAGGGFTWNSNYTAPGNNDEAVQETAYAILALNTMNRAAYLSDIQGAAAYLAGVQLATGGWENYTNSGENNEITGEALWASMTRLDVAWVDDDYCETCTNDGHTWGYDAFDNIQDGIDAVWSSTVYVAAGTYNENITVNKYVEIIGAGSGPGGTIITQTQAGAGDPKIGVVQVSASGHSTSEPLMLKNLRILPVDIAGISVGRFCEGTATEVEYLELNNVQVIGNNTNPNTEQERGLYVDLTSSINHMIVRNCAFNNLTYGWYFQKQLGEDASTVNDIFVVNTSFNDNNLKGLYAEKLENAYFDACEISGNGPSASGVPSYFLPWMAGMDINLKDGDYSRINVYNCTFTDNALGGAQNGVALTIKARGTGNDASYSSTPATVSNVNVKNCVFTGNERGIRIGEPGKNNLYPDNVNINYNYFQGNVLTYTGPETPSVAGALVNVAVPEVDGEYNWWGNCSGPAHSSNPSGTGDAVSDNVDFDPWIGQVESFFDVTFWLSPTLLAGQDGNNVSLWQDASCNSHNAYMNDNDKQPVYHANPGVEFSTTRTYGLSDVMQMDYSADITSANTDDFNPDLDNMSLFAVFKTDNLTDRQVIFKAGETTSGYVVYIDNGYLCFGMYNKMERKFVKHSTSLAVGSWYLAHLEYDSENNRFRGILNGNPSEWMGFLGLAKDGETPCGVGAAAGGVRFHDYNIALDYSRHLDGILGDVILGYADNYQEFYNYLADRYGIEAGYPVEEEEMPRQSDQWIYFEDADYDGYGSEAHLTNAYPNPTSDYSVFEVKCEREQFVNIALYNELGQKVNNVYSGRLAKGTTGFEVNGAELNEGLYIIKVNGETFAESCKVVISK